MNKKTKGCLAKFAAGLFIAGLLALTACAPGTPGTPVITNFTPEKGAVGVEVAIEGKNFKSVPEENTVKFAGAPVAQGDITYASETAIKVRVPSGAATGPISVTNSNGSGNSAKNFIVEANEGKWTFMVYLDADNNLESAGIKDFNEMAGVDSSPQVNILVQMDRIPGFDNSYGNWTGTKRFLVKKGADPASTPLQDMGEQNMGDPKVLQDFVEWGISNYPAQHYALVIWNHGDGWRKRMGKLANEVIAAKARGGAGSGPVKAVASDDTDDDILYMKEVQQALEDAGKNLTDRGIGFTKLDIVGFDACLMGMVEVAYALRNVAGYVVGSEYFEPNDGWPYDTILSKLNAAPSTDPKALCKVIVTDYVASYSSDEAVTQSAVDISKLENLAAKIDGFTVKATGEWANIKAARAAALAYHDPGYPKLFWGTDLWDFADKVQGLVASADIKTAANDLKVAIGEFVIAEGHSEAMDGSHGAAIYFPPNKNAFNNDPYHSGYEESNTFMPVDFVRFSKWDNWLIDQYYVNIP